MIVRTADAGGLARKLYRQMRTPKHKRAQASLAHSWSCHAKARCWAAGGAAGLWHVGSSQTYLRVALHQLHQAEAAFVNVVCHGGIELRISGSTCKPGVRGAQREDERVCEWQGSEGTLESALGRTLCLALAPATPATRGRSPPSLARREESLGEEQNT